MIFSSHPHAHGGSTKTLRIMVNRVLEAFLYFHRESLNDEGGIIFQASSFNECVEILRVAHAVNFRQINVTFAEAFDRFSDHFPPRALRCYYFLQPIIFITKLCQALTSHAKLMNRLLQLVPFNYDIVIRSCLFQVP